MFNMSTMIKLAACNKCADYYERVRSIGEAICAAAFESRCAKKSSSLERNRKTLETLTKGYAAVVCGHFKKVLMWEPDFVQQIIEHPDRTALILRLYRKGIAK
jgi:hypothetical protein